MPAHQSTNHLFLIRPTVFYSNPETQETNLYQTSEAPPDPATLLAKAKAELDAFADNLEEHGVRVTRMDGSPACPDHIFPGNWVSTHEDGTVVYYPMLAPNRRAEKTPEICAFLQQTYKTVKDYSPFTNDNRFLEGTGSFSFDRVNKIAYLAVSARSNEALAKKWAQDAGYELVSFRTNTVRGAPVYHTDLILFIGTKLAGLCTGAIVEEDRAAVVRKLAATHEIIDISLDQLDNMCGNALEVMGRDDTPYLILSSRGYEALTPEQKKKIAAHYREILHSPIPTIEKYGGGSARCLILELF
ncbi:MAG: arginine deiminase-related protein [Pseudomonadota bacterium]